MSSKADSASIPDLPLVCQVRGDQELVELAQASGFSAEAAKAVASIDAVMHGVRRSIQRRDFGRQALANIDPSLEVGHLDAISAIAHAPASGLTDQEVTVGLLAERLALDPSRASRLASDIVEKGYARRVASQTDARRICLELTEKGERFVEAVRRNKWQIFASALSKWNERELVVFAALFERFASWATDDNGIARSAENIKRMLGEGGPDGKSSKPDLADAE